MRYAITSDTARWIGEAKHKRDTVKTRRIPHFSGGGDGAVLGRIVATGLVAKADLYAHGLLQPPTQTQVDIVPTEVARDSYLPVGTVVLVHALKGIQTDGEVI